MVWFHYDLEASAHAFAVTRTNRASRVGWMINGITTSP
jgi:hypothetical protein